MGGVTSSSLAREPIHRASGSSIQIRGTVVLEHKNFLDLNSPAAAIGDTLSELIGQNVKMALVSATGHNDLGAQGRRSLTTHLANWLVERSGILTSDKGISYPVEFTVENDFGTPGALLVESHHPNEFFLMSVTLTMPDSSNVHFVCNSWVNNARNYKGPRIFFANKVYLPSQTPAGLQALRFEELENLQGQEDPTGERQSADRFYDYDVYNDLGNPDESEDLKRPVLGGSNEYPYPRRCRTNRKRTKTESGASTLEDIYVPRDEQFGHIKESDFLGSAIKSFSHYIVPIIEDLFRNDANFTSFQEIGDLYTKGLDLSECKKRTEEERQAKFRDPLELIRALTDDSTKDPSLLQYPTPSVIQENVEHWVSDEEFARETLSGLNPMVIERLKTFPPKGSLDASYGPQKSAITHEHIEPFLEGLTAEQAMGEKRLFIVDYHDVYVPYLNKINALEGKGYASRSLFFLTSQGTLKPIAIELILPPNSRGGFSCVQKVFTPHDSNSSFQWILAKAHAIINDAGYHQLVSHWLRTHACLEPFIIATYRQISALHPLYVLLTAHFKKTMNINALARKALINCNSGSLLIGGIIEKSFTTTKYSMEMTSAAYKSWRFDEQGLPADLIKRGMAEEDPSAEHGLRLLVSDYPFAVDGLEIWSAIQAWVSDYLKQYYKDDVAVREDTELQRWWTEIREVGHADKRDEPWWVAMETVKELEEVVVTLIWVASAHHAAVNFGQYAYAGYMPNKPTMGRKLIPEQGTLEYEQMQQDPEKFYLEMVSSRSQATIVMTTIEILSEHSSDEEYLGQRATPNWTNDEEILGAFQRFGQRLSVVEEKMKARNADPELKNRVGAVRVPYTLLMPTSGEGLTGKGIPNSTSI